MNYKFVAVGITLAISYASPALAQVYQCISNGRTTFTSIPSRGCTVVNLDKSTLSIIEPAVRAEDVNNQPEALSENNDNQQKIAQAKQELQDAQRALEEGRKIRLGNESNFVRFQERIQGLQDVVDAKQKQLDQLLNK